MEDRERDNSHKERHLVDASSLNDIHDRLRQAVDALDVEKTRRLLDLADEMGAAQIRTLFQEDMYGRLLRAIEACDPEAVRRHLQFLKDIDASGSADTDIEAVKTKLTELKPYLKEQYNVTRVGIFNSRLREGSGEEGNWEVLVDIEGPLGPVGFIGLENYLSDALGARVSLIEGLKKPVGQHILDEVEYL
ncbi:MAG TPA: hypothetical protein PLR60_04395 [Syntrophorhabdaceae bacterium]|nr:hypothetical protein [Syntrophorhabdaceae bacterium]